MKAARSRVFTKAKQLCSGARLRYWQVGRFYTSQSKSSMAEQTLIYHEILDGREEWPSE